MVEQDKDSPPFSTVDVTLRGGPLITSTPGPLSLEAETCNQNIQHPLGLGDYNSYHVFQGHLGPYFQMSLQNMVSLIVELSHEQDLKTNYE